MSSRPMLLWGLLILVAMAGVWIWRLSTQEPMSAWKDFPWTYITEAAVGSDEARVIINRGEITGPASVVDETNGQTAWPAFIHPDPAVVPQIDGKPCIFPLIPQGDRARTPVIPTLGRPLTQSEIQGVERYLTPEGRERMDVFRKEMGQ
jgi:hypothetical protein